MVLRSLPSGVRVRLVVQLAAAPIGYVRVQLGRRQVGVAEHLLDAAQVRAAFQEMRGEGVAKRVGVGARRVEAGLRGPPPEAEEGRRAASPGESVRGSFGRRRGRSSAAAGLSSRSERSCWWRKKARIAAVRRASVAGASPAARNSAR